MIVIREVEFLNTWSWFHEIIIPLPPKWNLSFYDAIILMSFKFHSTKRNYNNEKKMVTAWYYTSKNVKDWIVHYKLPTYELRLRWITLLLLLQRKYSQGIHTISCVILTHMYNKCNNTQMYLYVSRQICICKNLNRFSIALMLQVEICIPIDLASSALYLFSKLIKGRLMLSVPFPSLVAQNNNIET